MELKLTTATMNFKNHSWIIQMTSNLVVTTVICNWPWPWNYFNFSYQCDKLVIAIQLHNTVGCRKLNSLQTCALFSITINYLQSIQVYKVNVVAYVILCSQYKAICLLAIDLRFEQAVPSPIIIIISSVKSFFLLA